jgi:hypothetical protein
VAGQNPLFTDRFTADPAFMVADGTVYAYVGEDQAAPGGWFNMPHWLCYSSTDMKTWTAHGPVLRSDDFAYAAPRSAWAVQVVEKDGKYYFYKNGVQKIDMLYDKAIAYDNLFVLFTKKRTR